MSGLSALGISDSTDHRRRPSRLHFHLYSGPPSGGVRWRLLAANNRELGRGSLVYSDAEACRAGLARTVVELPTMERVVIRLDRTRWMWQLRKDGVDVVASGHAFERRPRCEEAWERFLRFAPVAPVRDAVTVLRWSSRGIRPSLLQRPAVCAPADHP